MSENGAVLRSVRHEVWADLELLRFCERLAPEQLRWTVPGTYGAIHNTLQHIVRAQRGYLGRLTGDPGTDVVPADSERLLGIDDLIAKERVVGERIERLLGQDFDPTRVITLKRGDVAQGTATAGVILAQFIHHGSDHRAHIGTILGAHGVAPPDLDVWSYGGSIGEVTG